MTRRIAVGLLFAILFINSLICGLNSNQDITTIIKYNIKEILTIGVKDDEGTENDPYRFYSASKIDCDIEGNIFVLDSKDRCVKKFDSSGKFIKRFFQHGEGPEDISNPFGLSINRFSNHIFILQNYGFTLKEFDLNGKYFKYHTLPQQFFGYFYFINDDEYIYKNSADRDGKFNALIMASIKQKKNIREFAPVEMRMELNIKQAFAVQNNLIWTSMANDMKLIAFDIQTGNKVQEIQIPGKFKTNSLIEKGKANSSKLIYTVIYNIAQPFVIDDQLFVFVILQDYKKKNGELYRFPVRWRHTIYQVNGSHFQELLILKDSEDLYVGNVFKNRLFLCGNEPYSRIRVLEFEKQN